MHLGRDKAYKIANIVILNEKRKTPYLPSNAVPLGISDVPSGFSDVPSGFSDIPSGHLT